MTFVAPGTEPGCFGFTSPPKWYVTRKGNWMTTIQTPKTVLTCVIISVFHCMWEQTEVFCYVCQCLVIDGSGMDDVFQCRFVIVILWYTLQWLMLLTQSFSLSNLSFYAESWTPFHNECPLTIVTLISGGGGYITGSITITYRSTAAGIIVVFVLKIILGRKFTRISKYCELWHV